MKPRLGGGKQNKQASKQTNWFPPEAACRELHPAPVTEAPSVDNNFVFSIIAAAIADASKEVNLALCEVVCLG